MSDGKTFKVLSIDGGGIRGIIPARILQHIEEQTDKSICHLFDLIAGTSTGGIIALALTRPKRSRGKSEPAYKAEDIVDLYAREGGSIFNRSTRHTIFSADGWIDKKYPPRGMRRVLRSYFGNFRLSDAITDVLIPSYDLRGTRLYWKQGTGERSGGHPRFFKSSRAKCGSQPDTDCKSCEAKCRCGSHEDYLMREVANATAAAPSYFEPVETVFTPPIDRSAWSENLVETLVDGGIFANNPAMCAYAEAKRTLKERGEEKHKILLVSLGTGNLTEQLNADAAMHWGKAYWIKPLFTIIFDGASDTVDYQLRQLMGEKCYYRFQKDLYEEGSDEMDDAGRKHLRELRKFAECLIEEQECKLKCLIQQLGR